MARRFSRGMVKPPGFWNVGMRYISFIRSFSKSSLSSSAVSMPSSPEGMPTVFAPHERKALSAPMNVGSSHTTVSPSLHSALQASSMPC